MKTIYLDRAKSLKELINNIGIGLYSTKVDDINQIFITSEKYPDTIIKPIETDTPKNVLIDTMQIAIPIYKKNGINLNKIETTGLSYMVYVGDGDTLMSESLLHLLCANVDSSEDNTYNMENPIWDLFIYVSDDYQPLVEDEVEDMDLPTELDTLKIPDNEGNITN